jgi:phosphoglycolate phosphatase
MRPTAVLFDLDGTLVDSLADLTASVNALLGEFGRPELAQSEVAAAIGQGARNLVQRTCAMRGVTLEGRAFEEAYGRFRAIYLERCCDATRPLPGALETIRDLAERGIPCGVVTNKPQGATDRLLAHLGFAPWIGAALGGDTPFGRKPSAEPVIEVARRLGATVPSERVWLVGDSKTDLDAAAAAGITAIGVRGGYDQGEPIDALAARAWRILDRIDEVRGLVQS